MTDTTDAAVRTLHIKECEGCVLGPTPELRERVVEAWSWMTGRPTPMTVRVPICFVGRTYPRSGTAVCEIVKRGER